MRRTPLRRAQRLSYRSKRREEEAADRRIFVVEQLAFRPLCEVRYDTRCRIEAVDVPEPIVFASA